MKLLENLLGYIPAGEKNAISGRELAALLNCNYRDITRSINFYRQHGAVICSSERGYFKPTDYTDVQRFVRTMRSRQRQIRLATASAEKRLRLYAVQQEFDGASLLTAAGGDVDV